MIYDFEPGKNREEKIDKFLDNLAWHFSSKAVGDPTARATEKLTNKLEVLNQTAKEANESSGRLAKALNRLTLAGVIVAGTGVLVALGHLVFEIIKYLHVGN